MACTVIEAADRQAELSFKQKVSVRGSKSTASTLWTANHIMDNGGVGRRPRRRQLLHGWTMAVAAVAAVATALAVERLRAAVAQATTCTPASTGPEENITAPVWT